MSIHVLLHLNLLSTPDSAREELYELLETYHWTKTHPSFTAWRCRYKDTVVDVRSAVIGEIKALAKKAGVPRLLGVGQAGNAMAFDFECRVAPKHYVKRI